MLRWLGWSVLGFTILLLASGMAMYMLLGFLELAPFASQRATAALGRKVTIGSLHITPGRWIVVTLRSGWLANLPTGSRPAMAEIARLTAEIDAVSLLYGPLLFRRLTVEGLDVILERSADKTANWIFHPDVPATSARPPIRAQSPIFLDARLAGDVTYRTSAGAGFRTHLDNMQILTSGLDAPVRLVASGQYNGVPLDLGADAASIAALRDASRPYDTDLRFASATTRLRFQGTMTDPLNVDGAHGTLTLDAPTLEILSKISGISTDVQVPLRLTGILVHSGSLWHFTDAVGTLANDTISSTDLQLDEGSGGMPDRLGVAVTFERLNLDALLGDHKQSGSGYANLPLSVDHAPDTLAEAKLSTKSMTYSGLSLANFAVTTSLKPGQITIDALLLDYLGATVRASGRVDAVNEDGVAGGRISARADISNFDVQALRRMATLGAFPLLGRMEGHVEVAAEGATLNQAAHDSRVSAVLTMSAGSISREVVELASTNPLALVRPAPGMSPISCLLAAIDMRAGIGTVSPLRIRAKDGTISGRGKFDLFKHQLDVTLSSDSSTTSAFALDVPIRVSGTFANPTIRPAKWSPAGRAELAAGDDVGQLLPVLQPFARQSPCLRGRAAGH